VSASEVLRKGLEDLTDLCDVVVDKFTASRDKFNAAHPDGLQSS
jgi:DNA-directed RNA polymerase I and III subunit RPAC2